MDLDQTGPEEVEDVTADESVTTSESSGEESVTNRALPVDEDNSTADTAPEEEAQDADDVTESESEPAAEEAPGVPEPGAEASPIDAEPAVSEVAIEEAEPGVEPAEPQPAVEDAEPGTEPAAEEVPDVPEPSAEASPVDAEPAVSEVTIEEAEPGVEPAEPQPAVEDAEPGTEPEAPIEEDTGKIKRGDLIQGVILETSPTEVVVDLGEERKGVITSRELERMGRRVLEDLKPGSELLVFVVNPHDHEGRTILSVNRAIEEQDWTNALKYHGSGELYEGNVAGYNKGGLIVRFGRLRGFVPQSQISDKRQRMITGETPEARYGPMVNDSIFVKVMEVDRSRNRLILSERAALREHRESRKEQLIEELQKGEVREGTVVSLEDFGAFVDIGGAEGLVHLTEISWQHVNHPRDVLKVGEKVKVEVISVDPARKRIGLSIKTQLADPWDEVATAYQVGDLVQATVTKLAKFGAFARLVDTEDIEGLIHISELSENRVGHPKEVVEEGEKVTLRVVKIDVKNRRLGLSLRRVNSAEYLDRDLKAFAADSIDSSGDSSEDVAAENGDETPEPPAED